MLFKHSKNKKSVCDNHSNFKYLDVKMEIKNGILVTGFYDKRKYFYFETIQILNFNSNVHIYIFRYIYLN